MTGAYRRGKSVLLEQLANFGLNEVDQFRIINHIALVQEHDDLRHTDLTGKQDVLARLRHRTVGRGDHEDRAVHLGGTRDHVLNVVSVARSVNVRIVALLGGIFRVMQRDRDTTSLFFRSIVDLIETFSSFFAQPFKNKTCVIAAVKVVLPWSTWPIVPTFKCGLERSNFSFSAMVLVLFAHFIPRSS
jgi:hypothetical protein